MHFDRHFWKIKSISEMTQREWECLCDRCARCCLEKLEDPDDGSVSYTCVACPQLDSVRCRCRNYQTRHQLVPDCLEMTPSSIMYLYWLPRTCAYRLLAEGKKLAWWHPLVSGDPESVHRAGISVRGKTVPSRYIDSNQLEAYIIADF